MSKIILAMTDRTDVDWPADHPLRRIATVISQKMAEEVGEFVICTIEGEARLPPAAGDHDVTAVCAECGVQIVHRASAPNLKKVCWKCAGFI